MSFYITLWSQIVEYTITWVEEASLESKPSNQNLCLHHVYQAKISKVFYLVMGKYGWTLFLDFNQFLSQ